MAVQFVIYLQHEQFQNLPVCVQKWRQIYIIINIGHVFYNMSTSSGTLSTQRKIFFSYQGTPSIYSDIFFSSLLPLFVLPEKNWMGWSGGCDCANPWPCTSLCHKKANPLGIQKALTVPSDILRVPHSHSIFFKTLIQLWIELSHLSTIPSTQN